MTNEEAIDILKGCKPYGSSEPEKMRIEFDEAINIAIEALKENERLSLLYSDMANDHLIPLIKIVKGHYTLVF